MTKTSDNNISMVRAHFNSELDFLLTEIKKKAQNQFEYNLNTNIPNKIADITLDNAGQQAINHGFSSGFNTINKWDCDKAVRIAFDILEDCNFHEAAKTLVQFIPEYQ